MNTVKKRQDIFSYRRFNLETNIHYYFPLKIVCYKKFTISFLVNNK